MRKFSIICAAAFALMLFSISAAHATLSLDKGLKASAIIKQLSFTGYTALNNIIITQNEKWDADDELVVAFDLCKIDIGPAGVISDLEWDPKGWDINYGSDFQDPAAANGFKTYRVSRSDIKVWNYYKLPYTVDWDKATLDGVDPDKGYIDVESVFYWYPNVWRPPLGLFTLHAGPPVLQQGDGAAAGITMGEEATIAVLKGIRIVQNMFPWRPEGYTVRASFYPADDPPTLELTAGAEDPFAENGPYQEVKNFPYYWPNFFCNPAYWHEGGIILATYGPPCLTCLKFGFVIGDLAGMATVLVVTSDVSTTCRDDKTDVVDFHAWDDFGAYLGKADGTFPLVNAQNSTKAQAQALIAIGGDLFTWGGSNWADANPNGIGQVVACAKQNFAHGVALIIGSGGIQAAYNALTDPSITAITASGEIQRKNWYHFKEPWLGYFIGPNP